MPPLKPYLSKKEAPRADALGAKPYRTRRLTTLLDETQREGVAVVVAVLGLREADNREDQRQDEDDREQDRTDKNDGQDVRDHVSNSCCDLEVQCFLSFGVGERPAVLEYQPDDERGQEGCGAAGCGLGSVMCSCLSGERGNFLGLSKCSVSHLSISTKR